ncbi:MAG: O-antigen ligase family protein [Chloroflexi bacterium]|nr:O-antigen ligase family protein [Chloroflexota bacterium]MCL5274016.1 O-antigen ligase family protein [Chloroflexota bacterium]
MQSQSASGIGRLTGAGWRLIGISVGAVAIGAGLAILPGQAILILGAASVAIGLIALIFAEPVVGLGLTLLIAPFAPLENIMLNLPVESGQVLLMLTLAAWLARAIYRRKAGKVSGPLVWPLLLFIGVGILSFFAAQSFELWARECLKWAEVLAVYAITINELQTGARSRNIIIGAILLSTLFEASLGFYQFWLRGTGPDSFLITGTSHYRAYGTFEQPNPFGGYMGLTWPFAAGLAAYQIRRFISVLQSRRPFTRYDMGRITLAAITILIAALALFSLVLSWSRGAWLGAAAAAVAMIIIFLRRPLQSLAVLAGVGMLFLALGAAGLIPEALVSRLTNFTQEFTSFDVRGVTITSDNHAVIERLAHWQAAEAMIVANPYLGVGFGNYPAAYDQYRAINWPLALGHAHNYYLNIFAETGLFGLLAYLLLWTMVMIRTIRRTLARRTGDGSAVGGQNPALARSHGWNTMPLAGFVALGLVGSWVQLSVHQVVDNLFVANILLLIAVYFGLLDGLHKEPHSVTAFRVHENVGQLFIEI